MHDIDLTPMNEAAARALYAEDTADRLLRRLPDLDSEQRAKTRMDFRKNALAYWDHGPVDGDTVLRYRELALAATLVNWKDIARQVRDIAYRQGVEDEGTASALDYEYGGPNRANPFNPENDFQQAGPHEG